MPSLSPGATAYTIETIYRQEHGWLKAWLQRKLGTSNHAADLAHDTFVRLLAAPGSEPIREPRAFLRTVAHGLLVNHWRRQDLERAWIETLAQLPPALAPSPEERAMALQTLQLVDAMLRRINPKARAAFLLSQLDGLTYAAIAAQLKVSERMVKRYMAQAMFECLLLEQA
ncbi:sigma-70 family RNA polymerase sigma factor [Comamonas piscis]|uniref:Sigma-70 family RNA polymerase sigma factor n=1 Tax=Comamonas piscis TaxID=1562974 RepID=A0A7G5EK06_9BURK|nr:sigma-70 family RNA polymerase sigma factor [Comamonas piscis]QMV74331.1 sigma-70 family RNA polymerase sigma factor [Comamonas piscis]WSO32778.1 sigma-70 family RNA polymerase sigma factor [Comamonas piscis]